MKEETWSSTKSKKFNNKIPFCKLMKTKLHHKNVLLCSLHNEWSHFTNFTTEKRRTEKFCAKAVSIECWDTLYDFKHRLKKLGSPCTA